MGRRGGVGARGVLSPVRFRDGHVEERGEAIDDRLVGGCKDQELVHAVLNARVHA